KYSSRKGKIGRPSLKTPLPEPLADRDQGHLIGINTEPPVDPYFPRRIVGLLVFVGRVSQSKEPRGGILKEGPSEVQKITPTAERGIRIVEEQPSFDLLGEGSDEFHLPPARIVSKNIDDTFIADDRVVDEHRRDDIPQLPVRISDKDWHEQPCIVAVVLAGGYGGDREVLNFSSYMVRKRNGIRRHKHHYNGDKAAKVVHGRSGWSYGESMWSDFLRSCSTNSG